MALPPPRFASYEDFILTGRGGRGGFGRGRGRGRRGQPETGPTRGSRGGGRGGRGGRGGHAVPPVAEDDFPVVEPAPARDKKKKKGKGKVTTGHDDFDALGGDELVEVGEWAGASKSHCTLLKPDSQISMTLGDS